MDQYLEQKAKHPDAILFFRMGDFYEMFFEDALLASKELEIALTSRNKAKEDSIPMCGVPYHSAPVYIQKLLDKGYKVAVCEQVENPSKAKKLVRRVVTRVISPGVVMSPDVLQAGESNYLVAVAKGDSFGLAFADFTTGEFCAFELSDESKVQAELGRLNPAEILLPQSQTIQLPDEISCPVTRLEDFVFDISRCEELIKEHFEVASLEGLGLKDRDSAVKAVGALIHYLKEAQGESETANEEDMVDGAFRILGSNLAHLKDFRFLEVTDNMQIDGNTRANLELVETLRERKKNGSLYGVLDYTVTGAGSRLLRKWILYPLKNTTEISKRLDAVETLLEDSITRAKLRESLKSVHDMERLGAKISGVGLNPRDLLALAETLETVPPIKNTLENVYIKKLKDIRDGLDPLPELTSAIKKAIREDAPIHLKEGGIFKTGFHVERDELEELSRNSKSVIARIEARERARTGIANLKVGYNKVFGYYIEVSKSNLSAVPQDYIRKQTLVGGERFITPELKELEEKILSAEEKIAEIEYRLFQQLRAQALAHLNTIKRNATFLAELDVYSALAEASARNNYCRPVLNEGDTIEIIGGRHPVVEKMNLGERFVPNDIKLDNSDHQVLIITGPNMAGKSTVMRQTALIVLMAQIGSFVPADKAIIGVVDRIFTRVGAADILHRGQSTFMVEMYETAQILRQATPKSLVLLDEIGRGTSTFDGLSIAWAVAERLHDKVGAKTMFATHYHELTDLAMTKERVKNVHIAVKEWEGKVIFLRKLLKGGVNRSYGIQVAKLAGIPNDVVERAKEILANLESGELEYGTPRFTKPNVRTSPQLTFFDIGAESNSVLKEIKERLKNLYINTLSPLEALNILAELKKLAE